jgi:hypothetical protein
LSQQQNTRKLGGRTMTTYRAYNIRDNRISGAPTIMWAETDTQAIEQAKQLVVDANVELWDGSRLVICLKANGTTDPPHD